MGFGFKGIAVGEPAGASPQTNGPEADHDGGGDLVIGAHGDPSRLRAGRVRRQPVSGPPWPLHLLLTFALYLVNVCASRAGKENLMRVLLIEDERSLSRSIQMMLERADHVVTATAFGRDGIDLAKVYDYDIILLDLGLPDISGHDVVRLMRMFDVATPILILTGETGQESKLRGFGLGADDYTTKPFSHDELLARINAIVRRSKAHSSPQISCGPISIDLNKKMASVFGKELSLARKEYQVLEILVLNKGMTMSKEIFLDHLYGGMDEPDHKIIDVFICKLRKKIKAATKGESLIETVWGTGYVLRDTDSTCTVSEPVLEA